MTRFRKRRVVFTALALLLFIGITALRSERAGEWVCAQVRTRAPGVVGQPVRIERCQIDPLSVGFEVQGIEVGPEVNPMLKAQEASVALGGFFFGGISIDRISITKPVVEMVVPESDDTAGPTCAFDQLRRIRIGHLDVQAATVRLRFPEGRWVAFDNLDVHASVGRKTTEVEASFGRGSLAVAASAQRWALGRGAVEATVDVKEQLVEFQKAEGSLEGVSLSGSAELRELCRAPHLEANGQVFVPLDALARLGIELPDPRGQLWGRVSVSGLLAQPSVRAELRASDVAIGPFSPQEFAVKASLDENRVVLEEFVSPVGSGEVRVSGELTLTQGFPFRAKVNTQDVSLAQVLERASVAGSWVDFPATVTAELSGQLAPSVSVTGPVEFKTGRFLLASRAYDAPKTVGSDILAFESSKGTFVLEVTPQAVTFGQVNLAVGPQARTRATGTVILSIERDLELDIEAVASSIDLADFGSIAGLPWDGTGSAEVGVHGPAGRVVVSGQTSLRDFKFDGYSLGVVQAPIRFEGDSLRFEGAVAQKGRTQLFGDVVLDFLEPELMTRASVQLPDGRLEDIVDLLVDLSPMLQNLQEVLTGRVSMVAAVDAPARELTGLLAVRMSEVEYFERRLGSANLILRFDHGEALVLEPTVFDGPVGRIAADGRWSFSGPLDYRVTLERGSLAEVVDPRDARKWGLEGVLRGSFTVGGTTDLYRVDGTLESEQLKLRGKSLGPARLSLGAVGRQLTMTGQVMSGVHAEVAVKAQDLWPYESRLEIDLPDASPLLPDNLKGLSVSVGGVLTATGPMREFEKTRAQARVERLSIARGEVSATNVGLVELGWNAGALEVQRFAMKGETTEVSAQGSWGPSRVDLRTQGSLDLRLLSTLVTNVERTAGRLDFTASFGGPVTAPTVLGNAALTDARLSLKGYDATVRSLSGRADFSESRIVIQDVNAFVNDGRVKARGDVQLDKLSVGSMALQFDVEDVTTRLRPTIPATLTGSVLLAVRRGSPLYQLSGGLEIAKLRYTDPLTIEALIENARRGSVPVEDEPNEWVRFDVDLSLGNEVRIDNGGTRARFGGKLKLTGTNAKPVLVGTVEALEGAQATFRGNVFNVNRGVLQFNGLWPTFDFSAQTLVREFLVNVKAFGRLDDPKVSLTAQPALTEADVLSLLTFGVTSRERLTISSGLGMASEVFFSATGLDRQVQKFLPQGVGPFKEQQVRLTTTFNESSGTAEPSVNWESKFLFDNLKLGVTQPVAGRGTKAQAEWRFNQGVSVRGQWDNNNLNTNLGNPGVDLRFRFEWE
jgi:translocation and assembly module TamB